VITGSSHAEVDHYKKVTTNVTRKIVTSVVRLPFKGAHSNCSREELSMKTKLLTGAFGLFAASAFAVAHAGSPADYFNKIDADASGVITQAEYVAFKTADGKHSAEEAGAKFAKVAGDDGEMTLAEFETAVKASKKKKHGDKDKERS
jgi:hypothetical protein